jgi:retron-type reverse transcriptase
MKRYGNLWNKVVSWENLVLAGKKAQKAKRRRTDVQRFNFFLEYNLLLIKRQLDERSYCPGDFRTHWITHPKPRLISAAPYRDRVVHHALMNVLYPILDRHFHPDSYACRREKGTHAAANRLQKLMRRYKYALQCDIKKFFPSIDHTFLKEGFRRLIKDKKVLWLMDLIVDRSNEQSSGLAWFEGDDLFSPVERRKGLPIGNLTSQWFANWYLNDLDRYVTSGLDIGAYVRYCDDFILLSNNRPKLNEALAQVRRFLAEEKRLKLHENKVFIRPVSAGLTFVGYRIWPTHRLLKKANIRGFRRRVAWMKRAYAASVIGWKDVKSRLDSWLGYCKHADARRVIRKLSQDWKFKRGETENGGCYPRRQLEQQCNQLPVNLSEQQRTIESQQQHRIPFGPALSERQKMSAPNRTVHGLCERGIESPGFIPELASSEGDRLSRIYAVRPADTGRQQAEGVIRPNYPCLLKEAA